MWMKKGIHKTFSALEVTIKMMDMGDMIPSSLSRETEYPEWGLL
jgi:hypothetical protein